MLSLNPQRKPAFVYLFGIASSTRPLCPLNMIGGGYWRRCSCECTHFLLVSLIFSLSLLTLGINAKNLVCTLCVSAHAYYACLWCLLIPSDISYPCHTFAFKSAVYISCKKNSWRHKHRRNSAALKLFLQTSPTGSKRLKTSLSLFQLSWLKRQDVWAIM